MPRRRTPREEVYLSVAINDETSEDLYGPFPAANMEAEALTLVEDRGYDPDEDGIRVLVLKEMGHLEFTKSTKSVYKPKNAS